MAARKPPVVNYLNLKRSLAGKGTTFSGNALTAADRKQIIGVAAQHIAETRNVSEARAMAILRRNVRNDVAVGGFVKGSRKGKSEGGRVTRAAPKPNRDAKPTTRVSNQASNRYYLDQTTRTPTPNISVNRTNSGRRMTAG